MKAEIGEHRLVPKGIKIFSISNQCTFILDNDAIVTVKNRMIGSDGVFVEPMQLLFNLPGQIPYLIGKGKDEWSLSFNETQSYKVPEPQF
jgi:hypothetical protein